MKNTIDDKENNKQNYIPHNLYLRLSRRQSAQCFIIYYFIIIIIMGFIGILFIRSAYLTRFYIIDGDKYWKKVSKGGMYLYIQFFNGFTGIFLICISVFSLMNNIVIILYICLGGLKIRLIYINYILLFLQVVLFIYSVSIIIIFGAVIYLYPILIVFTVFNLINSIILFVLVNRCIKAENSYLLSIKKMNIYKEEYYQDYISKNNTIKELNHKKHN